MKQTEPIIHQNLPVIEVAHGFLLDMIIADKKTKPYIMKRLSDSMAIVDPKHFDKLVERLQKMGHLPKVLEG